MRKVFIKCCNADIPEKLWEKLSEIDLVAIATNHGIIVGKSKSDTIKNLMNAVGPDGSASFFTITITMFADET